MIHSQKMSLTSIESPDFFKDISIHAGWWVDKIESNKNSLGNSKGGNENNFSCPTGIKSIQYTNGKRTGSIKFFCKDGTISPQYGEAKDKGEGEKEIFTCPDDTVLHKIEAIKHDDGISNISFECKLPNNSESIQKYHLE